MPRVRKKPQNTIGGIVKDRVTKPQTQGLAQKLTSVYALEALSQGKSNNLPDAEMMNAEPENSTNQGLEISSTPEQAPEASATNKGKEVVRNETILPAAPTAENTAVPAPTSTIATEAVAYPPELRAMVAAEERRAALVKARISICSTAISSVEAALSPASAGENKTFVDGLKVYLRATIAQFVHTGPGLTPPSLPSRPSNPPPTPMVRPIPPVSAPRTQAPENTWATVARNGHRQTAGPAL